MYRIEKYILIMFIIMFQSDIVIAQSLTGPSGLVSIPTAEVKEHGEVSFGTIWLDKKHLSYGDNGYNAIANFVTIGYLPFLEITLRTTRLMHHTEYHTIGDRMMALRMQVLKERKFLPSVVMGAHDFVWTYPDRPTNNFNALYFVLSKGLQIEPYIHSIAFHAGYGVDWLKAKNREFVGLFGGISVSPRPFVTVMAEYDARKPNLGLRLSISEHIRILLCLIDLDAFSGSLSYRFRL